MKKLCIFFIFLFLSTYSHAKSEASLRYYNYTQDTGYFGTGAFMFVYANYGDTVTLYAHDNNEFIGAGLTLPWTVNGTAMNANTGNLYNDTVQIVVTQSDLYSIQSYTVYYLRFKICMPPTTAPLMPVLNAGASNFCPLMQTYFYVPYYDTCLNTYLWNLPSGVVQTAPGIGTGSISVDITAAFSGDDTISVVAVNSIGTSPPAKMRLQCLTTGISELTSQSISITPNPATDHVLIKTNYNTAVLLQIINALGQIFFEDKNVVQQINIPVKNFARGVYTVKAGNVVKRFLKD